MTVRKAKLPRCWRINHSATAEAVFSWCLRARHVNRLLATTRLDQAARVPALLAPGVEDSVRRLFGDRLVKSALATAWPGSQLIGHAGKVYIVRFNEAIMNRIVKEQNKIAGWTQWNDPPLPEDLCLYRAGDRFPVFVSVTHEKDAWIFHDGEVKLGCAAPELTPFSPEYIPPPPAFYLEA